MAGQDIRLTPEVLRSINSASFTGSYQTIGTPLLFNSRIVKFTNLSTVNVTVSWNGITTADIVPAGGFLLIDVAAGRQLTAELYIPAGTQFWAEGTAGVGLFYLSSYYA